MEDVHCKEGLNENQRCIFTNTSEKDIANITSVCKNKGIFSPFTWTDGLFSVITFVGGAIAAGSGIGGGGIIVPTLVVVGKFSLENAIPLSSVRNHFK